MTLRGNTSGPVRRRAIAAALALMVAIAGQSSVSPTSGAEAPSVPPTAPGAWTATNTLSTVRSLGTATTLDGPSCRTASPPEWCGKVLAAGGRRGPGGVLSSAELYDPQTGTWAPTGSMSEDRYSHTATLLDGGACAGGSAPAWCGKVLVTGGAGGADGRALRASAELFDPAANEGRGAWQTAAAMPNVRHVHSAAALDGPRCRAALPLVPAPSWCGKVLVVAGLNRWPSQGSGFIVDPTFGLGTALLYDPGSNSWSATGNLTLGRYAHTLTSLDGGACRSSTLPALPHCDRVLIAGGSTSAGSIRQGDLPGELYDPDLGQWLPTAPMTAPRMSHRAVLLDGPACRTAMPAPYCNKVLVAGGVPFNNVLNLYTNPPTAELYDPLSDTWVPTGTMSSARSAGVGFTLTVVDGPRCHMMSPPPYCGSVLATGGAELLNVSVGAPELYDPLTGIFSVTGRQLTTVAGHAVAVDHRVLVFGGGGGGEGLPAADGGSFAELFDASLTEQPPAVVTVEPPSGPTYGGTTVTLSGAGLTAASEVLFGDVAAPHFVVESPTRIVATTPRLPPGEVDLTVRGPAGTSAAVNSTRFTSFDTSHRWLAAGSTASETLQPTVTALADGRALLTGGDPAGTGAFGNTGVEVFDPRSGRWEQADPLRTGRRVHTATRLADGRVLVVGGTGPTCCPALKSAEIFDPAAESGGQWTAAGMLNDARSLHTATLLPSGKVLVVGGEGAVGMLRSAEIFDPNAENPTWTRAGDLLDAGRFRHRAELLPDGRVLVAGGERPSGSPHPTSAQIYDPTQGALGTWSFTGSLAAPRINSTMTALPGGRVLVAGGCMPDDPCGLPASAEVWEPGADGGRGAWRMAPGMARARFNHAATLFDGPGCGAFCGQVLVVGGEDRPDNPLASAELYDPVAERWTPAVSLSTARQQHRVVLLEDGRALAVGGGKENDARLDRSTELFTPIQSNQLPIVTSVDPPGGLSGARVRIAGTGLSGTTVVSFGGVQVTPANVTEHLVVAVAPALPRGTFEVTVTTPAGTSLNDPEVRTDDFAHAPGRWRRGPSMSVARYLHTSTLLDGPACRAGLLFGPPSYCDDVLVAGGTTNYINQPAVGHRSAEVYDPSTAMWSATTSDMVAPRFNHTATLLDGPECHTTAPVHPPHCGKVLVVGGEVAVAAIAGAELYDPLTRIWTPTTPLAQRRFSHTATLLGDGRVLVVGGTDSEFTRNGLRSAEIYDPLTGTWTTAPAPGFDRHAHTATLLPDDRVLVVGGLTRNPEADDSLPGSLTFPDNVILNDAEIFDPAERTWTTVSPMDIPRFSHTATLLSGPRCGQACGKVLVVGGVNTIADTDSGSTTFHASAELYDPATRGWSPAPPQGTARAGHTATQLPNGSVLVVGSAMIIPSLAIPAPLASSEVYDPSTGRWSFTDFLATPRGLHAASLLDGPACQGAGAPPYCGTVLASGGGTLGLAIAPIVIQVGTPPAPIPLGASETYAPAPDVTALSPAVAQNREATPVVLTGTYFAGATAVRFGDTQAASFTVDSPTQITAMTPVTDAVGPMEVSVEGPGGTSALLGGNPAATFLLRGVPGAIATLVARAVSDTAIELTFAAAHNGDGSTPAQDYVVKQSPEEITEANFDGAGSTTLCDGKCHLEVPALSYNLRVDDLEPGRTYHYALRAVNDQGRGPLSNDASATTEGVADRLAAPACPALPVAGAGSVVYPGGRYSLIGLPGDTVVGSDSPLYGWSDLGAGGAYSVLDASQPVTGGKGYWAWFACPRAVDMSLPAAGGAAPASFALGAYHASMVGNPSGTSPATVTGHDFAARWDPALNDGAGGYGISGYREPQTLAVGEGTWTFSYVQTEIRINAAG